MNDSNTHGILLYIGVNTLTSPNRVAIWAGTPDKEMHGKPPAGHIQFRLSPVKDPRLEKHSLDVDL